MPKNSEPIYKIVKGIGLAIIALLWFIALVETNYDWGGEFYQHMHDKVSDGWNWTGLVFITLLMGSISGWYWIDGWLNDWRAKNTPDFATKKDIPTMFIRAAQFIFGIAGMAMLAAE